MNRLAMCGVLLGIGSFAVAQDLTRKISVEIPASRATAAFAELSKAAGIPLEAAGNLRDEVFVINAKDASVEDILKRIAQAESGRWMPQGGGYILTRDSSTSLAQERAEISARGAVIAKAVAKLTSGTPTNTKFDQADAQKLADETKRTFDQLTQGGGGKIDVGDLTQKTPSARAIARILASLDPNKLAQIGPNQRVVFSTQPTAAQLPLGNAGFNAFNQFITEETMYAKAYNANQPQDNNTRMFMVNGLGTPTLGKGDPRLGLGVGLVVVERRFEGGLNVQILAADPRLETIGTGSYTLMLPSAAPVASQASGEQPLKISDDAKEMAKALGGSEGAAGGVRTMMVQSVTLGAGGGGFVAQGAFPGQGQLKISPELRAKILHPEKYEPLAFAPGEAMLALSKQTGDNLVALLPDYCFGSLTRQMAGAVTPSQLIASLADTHSLQSKKEGGWLVVSPGLPASARANTVNRAALGTLLRNLDKNLQFHLDDLADFAVAQNKVPGMNDFDVAYAKMINMAATMQDMLPLATGSYSLYKFYGTLSSGQRQAVGSGRQLPFMNFSPQQLALISDMLYNSPQGPEVQQDQLPGAQNSKSTTFAFSSQSGGPAIPMFFGGSLSAKTERTIVVPNGITNDGFILGSVKSQPVVQAIDSKTGACTFMDAGNIAMTKSLANQPGLSGFTPPSYDRYRMAHQLNINLEFMFSPKVSMSRFLKDTAPDQDAQAGSYDALPGDFRAQVDNIATKMQQSFQNAPIKVRGIGGTPPPAP